MRSVVAPLVRALASAYGMVKARTTHKIWSELVAKVIDKATGLTEKQQAFAEAYVETANGTQSAIKAGFAKGSASVTANGLLKMPKVKAEIARIQAKLAKDLNINPARVLGELAKVAFSRITDVATWDNRGADLVNSDEITPDQAAAIAEIRNTKEGPVIKMHDKLAALDKLGRHLGLFESQDDKPVGVTIVVQKLFTDGKVTP